LQLEKFNLQVKLKNIEKKLQAAEQNNIKLEKN